MALPGAAGRLGSLPGPGALAARLGPVAVAMVVLRMWARPVSPELMKLEPGIWLALAAAAGITAGGLLANRRPTPSKVLPGPASAPPALQASSRSWSGS